MTAAIVFVSAYGKRGAPNFAMSVWRPLLDRPYALVRGHESKP